MKKSVITGALTLGLLAASQLATAAMNPLTLCPSLVDITKLPVTKVTLVTSDNNENFYEVSSKTVETSNMAEVWNNHEPYSSIRESRYTFSIKGIKATNPLEAIKNFQNALKEAATSQPNAVSIEPEQYDAFSCHYALNTMTDAVAKAYISGTDTENLYVLPKAADIQKLR